MQISYLLDRFHTQLAARDRLHPFDDFGPWINLTHAATHTAAQASRALAPYCAGAAWTAPRARIEDSVAVLDTLRSASTEMPSAAAVARCQAAFKDVCLILRARCDFSSL